jgi:hypothetical protein
VRQYIFGDPLLVHGAELARGLIDAHSSELPQHVLDVGHRSCASSRRPAMRLLLHASRCRTPAI